MRKALSLLLLLASLSIGLSACAPTANSTGQKVKCPACGYQFETPIERP